MFVLAGAFNGSRRLFFFAKVAILFLPKTFWFKRIKKMSGPCGSVEPASSTGDPGDACSGELGPFRCGSGRNGRTSRLAARCIDRTHPSETRRRLSIRASFIFRLVNTGRIQGRIQGLIQGRVQGLMPGTGTGAGPRVSLGGDPGAGSGANAREGSQGLIAGVDLTSRGGL